jgi:hypothetical protein
MTRTTTADTIVIKKRELKALLREVVREIVHDELSKFAGQAENWQLDPESPLYQALVEIRQDIKAGGIQLLTDKEVWGE